MRNAQSGEQFQQYSSNYYPEVNEYINRLKKEQDFYRHLNPDMKKTYEEYMTRRMNVDKKERTEEEKVQISSTDVGTIVLFIVIIIVFFESVGSIIEIGKSNNNNNRKD